MIDSVTLPRIRIHPAAPCDAALQTRHVFASIPAEFWRAVAAAHRYEELRRERVEDAPRQVFEELYAEAPERPA